MLIEIDERSINKFDTDFYKGMAILMIVIHNYFHVRRGFDLENELDFRPDRLWRFWGYFSNFDMDNWMAASFSYLGHHGVQIFIFISAYGLSIQYSKAEMSDFSFVVRRLKKIYLLLFFGIFLRVSGSMVLGNNAYDVERVLHDTVLLGSTLNAFSRHHLYDLFAGPFWFFGLIIQVYLIFPLLHGWVLHLGADRAWVAFVAAYALLYAGYFLTLGTDYGVLGSFVGHLPEVLLGICCARFGWLPIKTFVAVIALGVFVVSQLHEWAFLLSFLSAAVILLWVLQKMKLVLHARVFSMLVFFGKISMIMFIINTSVRSLKLFDKHLSSDLVLFFVLLVPSSYVGWKAYEFALRQLRLK